MNARIDQAHSLRPRLEHLLIAQQQLRAAHNDRLMEFEVERAIEELGSGEPTSHTETIERWASQYLASQGAA